MPIVTRCYQQSTDDCCLSITLSVQLCAQHDHDWVWCNASRGPLCQPRLVDTSTTLRYVCRKDSCHRPHALWTNITAVTEWSNITNLVSVFGCLILTSSGFLRKLWVKPDSCSDRSAIFGNGSFPWLKQNTQPFHFFTSTLRYVTAVTD